eukprot:807707-Amphidinium_carterae.2
MAYSTSQAKSKVLSRAFGKGSCPQKLSCATLFIVVCSCDHPFLFNLYRNEGTAFSFVVQRAECWVRSLDVTFEHLRLVAVS